MHNPQIPETVEGWAMLHQMFRLRWDAIRATEAACRAGIVDEAAAALRGPEEALQGASALVHLLGKADLMVIHCRRGFEELSAAQLALSRCRFSEWLQPAASFVSVVELGMYEMTAKIHQQLAARGVRPESEEFDAAFDEEMRRQHDRVAGRLYAELPRRRHVCFYPMNKRRGASGNWYTEPFERRAAMMREHGMIGRHYSGRVTQIISGALGLDDWEWGVDLFADDPIVFKKLIYEMRFDEASAVFAEFGPFYVGLQFSASSLGTLIDGRTPALDT